MWQYVCALEAHAQDASAAAKDELSATHALQHTHTYSWEIYKYICVATLQNARFDTSTMLPSQLAVRPLWPQAHPAKSATIVGR